MSELVQGSALLASLEEGNILQREAENYWLFPGYAKVQVAIRALQLGEPERQILQSLTWQEFEEFVAHVFTYYDFQVHHRFRFSTNRRFEIDIIARRKPILFCVDCKQYGVRLGKASVLRTATEEQLLRTKTLANHFARFQADLGCLDWQAPLFVPMLVTMMHEDIQFNDRTPIVPASNLNGFLLGFEEQLEEMRVVQPSSSRQKRLI
ncbi:MAG: restriction endonuclease [Candidatus Hermodarchaeota archaeon]|nr:restriction endonuclease [Candidatus Hermodarchaeota archaeon]